MTLITSLGTAMHGKDGEYKVTNYDFGDGKMIKNSLFLKAILESEIYEISSVIIIGTKTSNWDILINVFDSKNVDFWEEIIKQRENGGVSDENLSKIAEILSQKLGFEVKIFAHSQDMTNENLNSLIQTYTNATNSVNSDVLLDITHGFRSMPIFMYQALSFKFLNDFKKNIRIIYGEYVKEREISYVRNLSKYWEISQTMMAKNLFFNSLDGELLADILEKNWQDGAKLIEEISGIVKCNFALSVDEILKRIKNLLKDNKKSALIDEVKDFLQYFYNAVYDENLVNELYKYALFLGEKRLYVQAVIAMQVAVESKVVLKYGDQSDLGDYDKWENTFFQKYINLKNNFTKNGKKSVNELRNLRNSIAHGGAKNKYTNGIPKPVNVGISFEKIKGDIKEFLEFIDEF